MFSQSLSRVDSLQLYGLRPSRLLYPWNSPGKSTGMACHLLLQGSSWPRDQEATSPEFPALASGTTVPPGKPLKPRVCVWVFSCFSGVWLFATIWTVACQAPCPWNFPGKNSGVACHIFLQFIFLIQGSNLLLLPLLPWQADSLPLCHLGSPMCVCTHTYIPDLILGDYTWALELFWFLKK